LEVLHERGYLIVASIHQSTDYLACARALAKSLRWHMPDCKICLVTNGEESDPVFDIVKTFPFEAKGGWHDDWQVFYATPFRQTIKLEADMLITQPIDHWWNWFEHRDVVISKGIRNYQNTIATTRAYRGLFDDNDLPDVYNSITYWRKSALAAEFFNIVKTLFENWTVARTALAYCDTVDANTDMIYAIAAKMIGEEKVTLPYLWPNMIHMKCAANWIQNESYPWIDQAVWEFDNGKIRINTIEQQWPFHYHHKEFAHEAEKHYDELLGSSRTH
jgi:hypothetical protein